MAKKKAAKRVPRIWRMTIRKNGTFLEDPMRKVKSGDHIHITTPARTIVTIQIGKIDVVPDGGGGGPVVITS